MKKDPEPQTQGGFGGGEVAAKPETKADKPVENKAEKPSEDK